MATTTDVASAISAFERVHRLCVTIHDYGGHLRGVVGNERLQHRHHSCAAARANVQQRCLKFDVHAVQHLPPEERGHLRTCHAGVTEAMVIERNDVGLDWVLFAGPITEQHRKEDVLECLHQLAARLREWLVAHPTWPRAEPSQRGGAGSLPDRASHIRRWIDVHHREHVTLDDLAAELKLSRFQTSRTIQRLTNSSWSELLGAARLRTACALLMESDLDIVDIAIRSGFSDRAHFHRTFKKKFGLSPKRWADVAHQKEA